MTVILPDATRPEPPGARTFTAAFGYGALLKIRHVPEQPFDVIAIPVVFTLMFTYLFGGALAGSPGRYLPFLLPGAQVMPVLLVTMYAGIGLNTDVAKGITGRSRSLPVWRSAPVADAIMGDVARYLIAAGLVTVLGVIMGYRPAGGAPGVLARIGLLLVFALCPSWTWTALGLVMRTPQAVMGTGTVVLFPLTLISNVFVQPATMPAGCRPSSRSTRSAIWSPPSAACWLATRPPGRPAGCCSPPPSCSPSSPRSPGTSTPGGPDRPARHGQDGGRGRRGELTALGFTVASGPAMSATARCLPAC
jgi:ABC-2 type transport system permease protein